MELEENLFAREKILAPRPLPHEHQPEKVSSNRVIALVFHLNLKSCLGSQLEIGDRGIS